MKNLSLALNVVLIFAVGFLYYKQFSGAPAAAQKSGNDSTSVFTDVSIAYVNSDSLLAKYNYMNDIQDQLDKHQAKLEKEYQNRAEGLQNEIEDFKRTANTMTIAQAKAQQQNLQQKQQNLYQYQQSLSQQLAEHQADLTNKLYDKVAEYLKGYGKKHNLQVVLTYTKGSGVLYANDSLDITNAVVEGLNKEYNGENGKGESKADTDSKKEDKK